MKKITITLSIVIGFLCILCLIGYCIYVVFGYNGFINYASLLCIIFLAGLTGSFAE